MEQLLPTLSEWSVRLFPLAVDHLWHSSLIAVAVLLLLVPLRSAPARWRYSLVLLAAAKFLLPTSIVVDLLRLLRPELGDQMPTLSLLSLDWTAWMRTLGLTASAAGAQEVAGWMLGVVAFVWIAGALLVGLRWWLQYQSFARRVRAARRLVAGRELLLVNRVRARLGLERPVAVAVLARTEGLPAGPGVWGVFRPVLVLPAAMSEELNDAELEAVLVHELVHVARWDNLVAHLQMFLCGVLWFHPLVWSLDRRLLAAREEACDERAVALLGSPETYARGLLKVVRLSLDLRLPALATIGAADLRTRLERILAGPAASRATRLLRVYAVAVGLVLIVSGLVLRATPVSISEQCAKRVVPVRADDRCPDKPVSRLASAPPESEQRISSAPTSRCRKAGRAGVRGAEKLAGAPLQPGRADALRDGPLEQVPLLEIGEPAFHALP